MDSYKIEFSRRAEKELRRIDTRYIPRILGAIEALATQPRPQGFSKLEGTENTFRVRVGSYRVVYEVKDDQLRVLVIRIRHRQSAYD